MKKTEQQLAEELDLFLTALQKGETPPAATSEEAELAAQLLKLAEDTAPGPEFDREMENQLERTARQQGQQKKAAAPDTSAARPSSWQQLWHTLKEGLTMKRTTFALGGIAAVVLIAVVAYVAFLGNGDDAPTVADNGAAVVETVTEPAPAPTETEQPAPATEEAVEVADLPLLPGLQSGSSGFAGGLGGGGGTEEAAVAAPAPMNGGVADTSMPIFTDIFSGTEFVLNATLPEPVGSTQVFQQRPQAEADLATARRFADAFGFGGPLYTQPQPEFEDGFTPPVTYFAFDGTRMLNVDAFGVYYSDQSVSFDNMQRLPFEQIGPQAEAYLLERGLLDFEYEIARGWMNDVFVYRVIDGRTVNQPEITVSFNDQGQIMFVNVQTLRNLEDLGSYPLRTAEEAWQIIQDGIVKNNVMYNYTPDFENEAVPVAEPTPVEETYRFWSRTYEAGDEAHIYTWPGVFLPADGDGAPRIMANQFVLQADGATLEEIAADPFALHHVWGRVGDDGKTLVVEGFEQLSEDRQPLYLQGTIQREDEQVLFTAQESGDTYIIPDAPEDLPTDEQFNLFAWGTRDVGADYPVVDWENLDVFVTYSEPEALPEAPIEEPIPFQPEAYQQVTANGVELVYVYTYRFPEQSEGALMRYEPPTIILQPAWKFSGTADNGDNIDFFVEAVAPEFIQSNE